MQQDTEKIDSFFLSRHKPTEEQIADMNRICKKLNANNPQHMKDWHNSVFKQSVTANKFIKSGSIVFMVGSMRHYKNAKECGYRVIIPYFGNREHGFSHHKEFKSATIVEVPV